MPTEHVQEYEYKVITQTDKFWGDRFEPWKIQQLLNEHAEKGWQLKNISVGDMRDWTSQLTGRERGQIMIILERRVKKPAQYQPDDEHDEALGYDAARIPTTRWYANIGNISTILQNAGLVTKDQMNQARQEFANRGGHLADHLLALGLITDEMLRDALNRPKS